MNEQNPRYAISHGVLLFLWYNMGMTPFDFFAGLCDFSRGNKDYEENIMERMDKVLIEYNKVYHPIMTEEELWKSFSKSLPS